MGILSPFRDALFPPINNIHTMQLLKIGNRIINPAHVTHVSYEPDATNPGSLNFWQECVVSFTGNDCEIFYDSEAEIVWAYFSSGLNSRSFAIHRDTIHPDLIPDPSEA
jgi:hypothetical protein